MISKEKKAQIIAEYGRKPGDTAIKNKLVPEKLSKEKINLFMQVRRIF